MMHLKISIGSIDLSFLKFKDPYTPNVKQGK